MNNIEKGKENLQKALLEVSKNYLENLELAPEESVSYSPKLERKMNRFIRSQRKPYWKLVNTSLKRALVACLAAVIIAGTLFSCAPIRESIFEFFTTVYEKFTEFFFEDTDTDEVEGITEIHTLTYVPEGYELVEGPKLSDGNRKAKIIWKTDDGYKIVFWQMVLTGKITIDTENVEIKNLPNNTQIAIIQKPEQTYVFWNDDQYSYTLIVYDLSEEEIIKIVNSFN